MGNKVRAWSTGSYKQPGNWKTTKRRILLRDQGLCFCGTPAVTVDAVIPDAQGGSHQDDTNLRAICQAHHDAKTKLEAAQGRANAAAKRRSRLALPREAHPSRIPPDA